MRSKLELALIAGTARCSSNGVPEPAYSRKYEKDFGIHESETSHVNPLFS